MKIIIAGGGNVGLAIAETLRVEHHDIALIDTDVSVAGNVGDDFDILGIHGSGVVCDDLESAGIEDADLLIATAGQDEVNILSCATAKKMGVPHCIARVRDPELTKQFAFLRDELGLSFAVNPEFYAANEIYRIIRLPSAIKVESFAKGRIDIAEVKIEKGSIFDNLSLVMLPQTLKTKLLVCAVLRGNDVFIPKGDFVIQAGDKIHVTATHTELASFFKSQGMMNNRIKDVMLIGGGHTAYYLTRLLLDFGVAVKIIEIDHARCVELSQIFPKAKIINGDGTNQDLLISENISGTGACIALTNSDEENVIISLFAKLRGAGKVITKTNKLTLKQMAETVGLDSPISPKLLTADMIVRYVRAMQNAEGSNVHALSTLVDDKVEAVEFVATAASRILNTPLKSLPLKPNLLISGIIRNGKVIIPNGSSTIEKGDSVVVVTTNLRLQDLDEIVR